MRYSDSPELSKVSLLSLTLFIFSAGIFEVINPYPVKAASIRATDTVPILLLAQSTPPANPAVTPQATSSPVSAAPSNREGGDVTLWWLLFLCLGLPFVLLWLRSQMKTTTIKPSTLILTPETGNTARIYWEIPSEKIRGLRRRGGTSLVIRLMDVTNINPQVTNPQVVQQVPCSLGSPLISLQVPEVNREYQTELGCVTQDGGWISLAKSAPAYFPAPRPFLGGLGAGIVTAIGSTAISSFAAPNETQEEASQPQVAAKIADKTDVVDNSSSATGVATIVDHPTSPTEEVENTEVIDRSPEAENNQVIDSSSEEVVTKVEIIASPVQASAEAIDSPSDITDPEAIDNGELSHSPEAIEPAILLPPHQEAIGDEMVIAPVEPKAEITTPSEPEDLPPEEISPPISSVVPTVDDGGSSLNWGVVGGAAVAEVAPLPKGKEEVVLETPLPRVNLIPSDEVTINGSWVLPESTKANYESQGGIQLALRIYNVTGIDPEIPLTGDFRQLKVTETGLDSPLTIENLPNHPSSDASHNGIDSELSYGDYQGELGYLTATEQWLGIAKSNRVRLPLEGKTQIRLAMHTTAQGYVTWMIAPRDMQLLKAQGIRDFKLRIHDVTDIDLDHAPAHDTQEYGCEMDQRDRYVPITVGDRPYADYIAELGSMTNTGEWLRIIRSLHIRFFS